MATVFDRETWLNISVNIVPLFILVFFLVLFTVASPWGGNLFMTFVGHMLTIIPLVLLALLTWVAARVVEE